MCNMVKKWSPLVLCVMLWVGGTVSAEDELKPEEGWKKSADLALSLNQSSYSNSWTGGESGSITWTFTGDATAERAFNAKTNWRNNFKLAFGQTHSQTKNREEQTLNWLAPEKSSDRIFFESLLRFTLGAVVDPYVAGTFESQIFDASVAEKNRYINPMTVTQSAGIARAFIKKASGELMSRAGLSLREHMSRDILAGTDPIETENNSTVDGGIEWVTDFNWKFSADKLKYVSKLRVFEALFNSSSDDLKDLPQEDYWKSPDVAWENTISASVSKYIQASLFCELLYDKEIDVRGRFREVLGLGIAYKMF